MRLYSRQGPVEAGGGALFGVPVSLQEGHQGRGWHILSHVAQTEACFPSALLQAHRSSWREAHGQANLSSTLSKGIF